MPVDLKDFYERNKPYFGDKPLADVAQEAYQKSGASQTHTFDQWLDWTGMGRQQIEEDRFNRLPIKDGSTLGALARTVGRIPENVVAKGIQALQGQTGASVTDRGLADQYVNWVEKRNRDLAQEYSGSGNVPLTGGLISKKDVAELGPNLAYSGASMLGTIAGGGAGSLAGPIGTVAGGMTGGGLVAHRMTGYQVMNDWLEQKNKESIKNLGRGISPEEETRFKKDFDALATESGLWEAGPEAVGNVLELALMKSPLGRLAEIVPKGVKGKIAKGGLRALGLLGVEGSTETVTQMGQQKAESKAGMSDEPERDWSNPDDWLKSVKEVLPAVILQTGVMSGGGAAYRKLAGRKVDQGEDQSGITAPPVGPITAALNKAPVLAGGQIQTPAGVVQDSTMGQQVPADISALTGLQPMPGQGLSPDPVFARTSDRISSDDLSHSMRGELERTGNWDYDPNTDEYVRRKAPVSQDQEMPGQEFQPMGQPSTAEQAAQVLAGKQTPAIDSAFAMAEMGIDSPYYPDLDNGQGAPSDPRPKDIKDLSLESLRLARPAFEQRNRPDIVQMIDAEIANKTNKVPEHLRQIFGIMRDEANAGGIESLKHTGEGGEVGATTAVGRASSHAEWFQDLNQEIKKNVPEIGGIDKKTFDNLLTKKETGQPLTDRQDNIWKAMQDAAEKYSNEHPDTVISQDEARIKKMGYEPNHGQEISLTELAPGDKVLFGDEEFQFKGFDNQGLIVFKDGETIKVDPFETITPDGIKRTEKPEAANIIQEERKSPSNIRNMVERRRDVLAEEAKMQRANQEPRGRRGLNPAIQSKIEALSPDSSPAEIRGVAAELGIQIFGKNVSSGSLLSEIFGRAKQAGMVYDEDRRMRAANAEPRGLRGLRKTEFSKTGTEKKADESTGTITEPPIYKNITSTQAAARQPWEMDYDELRSAVNPNNWEQLQASRPVIKELYGDLLKDKGDPWGLVRAVEYGDELPRTPTVDLSKRHKASIQKALKSGALTPAGYTRLHEKDYGPIEKFAPEVVKDSFTNESTIKESLQVPPVGTLVSNGPDIGKVFIGVGQKPRVRLADGKTIPWTGEWIKPTERLKQNEQAQQSATETLPNAQSDAKSNVADHVQHRIGDTVVPKRGSGLHDYGPGKVQHITRDHETGKEKIRVDSYGGAHWKAEDFVAHEISTKPVVDQKKGVDEAQRKPTAYGANNKIFTEDRANKAREILRKKLGQLNAGIDPELLSAGIELAGYHIEAGARKFADYAKNMIDDLGDGIRPYLKAFYNAVRDYPGLDNSDLDSHGEVGKIDVNSINLEAANGNQDQSGSSRLSESLEEVPAQNVQGNDENRDIGTGGERRGGADRKGVESTGKPGDSLRSGGRNDTEQIRLHPGGRGEQSGGAGKFRLETGQRNKPTETRHTLEARSEEARTDCQSAIDYRISPKTRIGEGGQKTKYKNNVAAIRLLKDLLETNRIATPEEQDVLARYVGWGGISQAFDESNSDWSKEFKELKEILTPEEWDAAFESTQYAHYTSEQIIRGMYGALNRLGFSSGKVLEPGSGVGNFIGLLPDDMVGKVRFTAVERDFITAQISKHLYPNHNMQTADFAEFNTADGSFDFVLGNPPFSDTAITDKSGRKHLSGLHVHNYFFAKSLDLLREGGIMAMVVSNSFLDAKNDRARRYIGDRAELLGAIRLPNNAFMKNAGTEVTTDIVFLRKYPDKDIGGKLAKENREKWESLVLIPDPRGGEQIQINKYYADHPEMLLGTMERSGTMYRADQPALTAFPDKNLSALLTNAIKNLPEKAYQSLAQQATKAIEQGTIVALQNPDARVGNYYVHGMSVYRRIADIDGEARAERITPDTPISEKKTLGFSGIERLKLLSALRETVRRQLAYETIGDDRMEENRKRLNEQYDEYLKKFDHLNSEGTRRVFKSDPDYPLLMSLEHKYKAGVSKDTAKKMGTGQVPAKAIKAPIFTTRVIEESVPLEKAETPQDALMLSLSEMGRVDSKYIGNLLGRNGDEVLKELASQDNPSVYFDPKAGYVTKDEYLSGNVKKKLKQALAAGMYDNVKALEKVIPEDIPAHEINAKIGAHWIPETRYETFAKEILSEGTRASVKYVPVNGNFIADITAGNEHQNESVYGTPRMSGAEILEHLLSGSQIKVGDWVEDAYGSRHFVLDKEETERASDKAQVIKDKFGDWLFSDVDQADVMVKQYNDLMNTNVERKFDGSNLRFVGKVPDSIIKFRKHQRDAISRIIQNQQALLDHVVGSGKTFTIIGAIMESKRMGLTHKPMVTVPNHLVQQWASDFYRLYPGANILATTKNDFKKESRRKLLAKIATGNWDAVIVAHSQFGFIKPDPDFEYKFMKQTVSEINQAIQALQAESNTPEKKRTVKQLAKRKERLQNKLAALRDKPMDDLLDFGQLGIDSLYVDEFHMFKNLMYVTKMQNVRGLSNPDGSKRAYDMYTKIHQLYEKNGAQRGLIAATGTPVSNSLAEMYHMMRYLAPQALEDAGHRTFDAWARTFADVEQVWMQSLSGEGYKATTRMVNFVNAPELLNIYHQYADTVTNDDVMKAYSDENDGARFPIPPLKGGRRAPVSIPISEDQSAYMADIAKRAKALEQRKGRPQKGEDNMLSIMTDARKAAMDIRLVDKSIVDRDPNGRIAQAAGNIIDRYNQFKDVRGTQLVFSDMGTPKKHAQTELREYNELNEIASALQDEGLRAMADLGDEAAIEKIEKAEAAQAKIESKGRDWHDAIMAAQRGFSVYDDLRMALVEQGIPDIEIAFIHDYNTDLKKTALFKAVNDGNIRVLIGSTEKMGAGTNVQERLVALHHIDVPWKPSDVEQREGRIVRQGNLLLDQVPGFEVEVMAYATQDTLDLFMWQVQEKKLGMIGQLREGKIGREIDNAFEELQLSAGEMQAAATSNPYLMQEIQLKDKIKKLERKQRSFEGEKNDIIRRKRVSEKDISNLPAEIERYEKEEQLKIQYNKEVAASEAKKTATVDGVEVVGGNNIRPAVREKILERDSAIGDLKQEISALENGISIRKSNIKGWNKALKENHSPDETEKYNRAITEAHKEIKGIEKSISDNEARIKDIRDSFSVNYNGTDYKHITKLSAAVKEHIGETQDVLFRTLDGKTINRKDTVAAVFAEKVAKSIDEDERVPVGRVAGYNISLDVTFNDNGKTATIEVVRENDGYESLNRITISEKEEVESLKKGMIGGHDSISLVNRLLNDINADRKGSILYFKERIEKAKKNLASIESQAQGDAWPGTEELKKARLEHREILKKLSGIAESKKLGNEIPTDKDWRAVSFDEKLHARWDRRWDEKPESDIVFSDAKPLKENRIGRITAKMAQLQFRDLIDKVTDTGVKLEFVDRTTDISEPDLQRGALAHEKATGRMVRGFFHKNSKTLYVITGNIRNMAEVAKVVAHELVGHHGLYEFMGKDLKPFLDFMIRHPKYGPMIQDKGIARKIDMTTAAGRQSAAKEFFAEMVEKNEIEPSLWSRFVVALKNALRRAGFKNEWLTGFNDDDIAEIIRGARLAVEGKGRKFGESPAAQQIAYESGTDYSIDSVLPWPEDFPNIIPHSNQAKLSGHPLHQAAKAGDTEAAIQVVRDLFKPAKARELAKQYPGAVLVPVRAVESTGHNRLPLELAEAISDTTGLEIDQDIYQSNQVSHTESNRLQRLLSRATFDGKVIPGQKYILVEDTAASGGTLHELRHYIENNGGKVVAATTLGFGRGATVLAIKPETIAQIERKFGREPAESFLREYNISGNLEALTDGEGRFFGSQSSLDSLRTAIAEGRIQGGSQNIEGSLQGSGLNQSSASPASKSHIDFSDTAITGDGAPIHDYLKAREAAAAKKGSSAWIEPRANISQVDMLFSQMLYYAPKVPALKKMYDAAGKYLESKTGKQREILYSPDGKLSYTKELERIAKAHWEQFKTLGKYLVTLDMAAKGYKVKQKDEPTEGGGVRKTFILVAPKEDWKEGTFSTEKAAWKAAIEYEAEAYAKFYPGAHPDIIKALTIFRSIGHNMYDMLHQSMEAMIEEYEKAGKPLPEFSFDDASTGKKVRMTLKKAMSEMGDIRGSYFPRTRKPGAFTLIAIKEDENPILEKFDIALTYKNEDSWQSKIPIPINLRAAALRKQGYDVTMMKSDALPESVFLELSGQSIALESLLIKAFDQLNANQEHSLKDMGIKSKWDGNDFLIYGEGIHAKTHPAVLQHLGGEYKYVQKKGEEGYPSIRFKDAKEGIAEQVKDTLLKHAQSSFVDTMFGNSLITTLADIFKARGGRSGMVARHKGVGVEVWKGYEEDPIIAYTRAAMGIAGATAKGELAKQLHGIITGRTESWTEYQQRIVDTTPATEASYAEYQKEVEARKISATKQPNAYKLAQSYTQSLLRNDEPVDRIVGVAGGLAVLKYLWGRPGAVFVNLTNMAAGVPGSMKGHAGIPINKTFGLIGKAGLAYKNFKFGDGKSLDKWTLSTLEHIEKSGWDQAQYNQEAMAPLKGKFGRAFERVMELGMLGFSVSEKINRVSTILGTYMGIKEMHKGPWNQVAHEAALEKAKEVSDKAHGVYGDVNRPYLAQGGGVVGNMAKSFFMFKTFSHNYVLNMIELGFKKEIKAMSYLALAPAIMAGASASVLTPLLMAACKAFGVDDPEEEFYAWMEKEMGSGSAMYARTGLLGLGGNGPALKGSLSIGITDLPTSMADILGAPAGIAKDLADGAKAIGRGDLAKGVEKVLPNSLAATIRAYRESTEGLTTSGNAPRFFGDKQVKLTGYEAAMRALSFNPARIAVIQDIQRGEYRAKEMLQKQRHEIYSRARRAIIEQDQDEYADVLARMNRYNLAVKGNDRYSGYPLLTWKKIILNVRKSQKPSKLERNRQVEL